MSNKWLLLFLIFFVTDSLAQEKKNLTLEDIWQKGTFSAKSVSGINWTKDGQYYTNLVYDQANNATHILRYNTTTGLVTDTIINGKTVKTSTGQPILFDEYQFNSKQDQILLTTNTESIYRRSYTASYFIYDVNKKTVRTLSDKGAQSYATFSPDDSKIAFVRENNLFITDLTSNSETQVTTDGKWNFIINGSTDWVYEEEFSFAQAFFWAPDGKRIAYYKFDESQVKEYNMQLWGELYPKDYKFKYPKAGEANSKVQIYIYDLGTKNNVKADVGSEDDIYIPRVKWTADPNTLSIRKLNRLQNNLEVFHVNAVDGKSNVVLNEKTETYVDLDFTDDLTYLSDKKSFLFSSEKDGYKHLYLYDISGKLINQITTGQFEVSEVSAIDEKGKKIYFMSTEVSPMERQLYVIGFDGKGKKRLTTKSGTYSCNFSPDAKYFIANYSNAVEPATITLNSGKDGKELKMLEDNKALKERLAQYNLGKKEFFTFNTVDNTSLNAYIVKPADFRADKKYPVLMFVYGGPGSQQVLNSWGGTNYLWFQMLAQKGYLVVCVDNRGTGARGRAFRHSTYANLGKLESQDQIEGAKYLAKQSYVDPSRIGIWGWSYGGYMSSLCLFTGSDVFKAAIAVAPVTNWRFYDTVYTERYLKTPQENAKGYDAYSPLTHAGSLKGNLLLIHGTGDDNVHFQNSVELQTALIKANKQFESFYYPNKNHGISGGVTRLHLYGQMTDFLIRKL